VGAGSDHDVARLQEELRVGAAELAAVPAESRALFAKVLGRLEGMRGEVEALKAGKVRSDERITNLEQSLSMRVAKLEENGCEDEELEIKEKIDEQEEPEWLDSTRRRAQAVSQACARVRDFQALSAAAMDACCPPNGGGRRRLQASCDLPAACPSAACAAVFVPYMQDCAAMLAATPGVPVADFRSFAASCTEMQAGAGQMLQPVAVQMFRVLVNTEGAAQAGAMFPGGGAGGGDGGAGQPLNPLQPLPPVPPSPPDATGAGDDTTGVTQVLTHVSKGGRSQPRGRPWKRVDFIAPPQFLGVDQSSAEVYYTESGVGLFPVLSAAAAAPRGLPTARPRLLSDVSEDRKIHCPCAFLGVLFSSYGIRASSFVILTAAYSIQPYFVRIRVQ
jgi:hypothetical protein